MSRRRFATALALAGAAALTAVTGAGGASAQQLGNTGSGKPALVSAGGRLYIAWTGSSGTAAAKDLQFGWSTSEGLRIQKVLVGEKTPQNEGPALTDDGVGDRAGSGSGVFIAWPAGNNANTLTAAFYDGAAVSCRTSFTGVTTAHSPSLTRDLVGNRFISWVDPTSHINVARLDSSACASTHRMTLTSRVVLPETTVAGVGLAYDKNPSSNLGLMIAWSGTDAAHLVHVASFDGTSTLKLRGNVGVTATAPPGSLTGPSLGSGYSDNYLIYQGTDGAAYLGYSEGASPAQFNMSRSVYSRGLTSGIAMQSLDPGYIAYFDASGHLNVSHLCCNVE